MITSEIFQVGGRGFTSKLDAAIYLIKIGEEVAIIDAGCGRSHNTLIKNINELGVRPQQVKYLFITHCHYDHSGGVKDLQGWSPCCRVIVHEKDALYLEKGDRVVTAARRYNAEINPIEIDHKIEGKYEDFFLMERKITAFHMPGHSPGSLVYLMESDGYRVLFGQDVHGPIAESLLSSRKDYNNSLKQMLSLNADILCEGHFGVMKGLKRVARYIESHIK